MRRTKFLSDRQPLVPGLTDLAEDDLETTGVDPWIVFFGVMLALGLGIFVFFVR